MLVVVIVSRYVICRTTCNGEEPASGLNLTRRQVDTVRPNVVRSAHWQSVVEFLCKYTRGERQSGHIYPRFYAGDEITKISTLGSDRQGEVSSAETIAAEFGWLGGKTRHVPPER